MAHHVSFARGQGELRRPLFVAQQPASRHLNPFSNKGERLRRLSVRRTGPSTECPSQATYRGFLQTIEF